MGRREQLASLVDLVPEAIDQATFAGRLPALRDVEVIFSSWGMPTMTAEQLDALPKLRAVFYAAGTVQSFARRRSCCRRRATSRTSTATAMRRALINRLAGLGTTSRRSHCWARARSADAWWSCCGRSS
jgi:hypothetical protein